LTDPRLRETLAASALARAHRDFTVEVMADRYLELYHGLLAGRSRKPAA
jgi:glycosyltransferase involved in cell wall biosynthesis